MLLGDGCVVHGIPREDQILQEGDIISVDCGTLLDGYNGDSAFTFPVGEISDEVRQLLRTTKESLYLGIEKAVQADMSEISDLPFRTTARRTAMVS